MESNDKERVAVDVRLLTDAVIELNISRRSVGLYPAGHPITRESLNRAYEFLLRLFELRADITLGVAKDTLIIDDYTLERSNPVFREFASSLYNKGIAAVTFIEGLTIEELLIFHEMLVSRDATSEQKVAENATAKGLMHIRLTPLDVSKFRFIEDAQRKEGDERNVWENYIYGLIEGKLADPDAEGVVYNVPPQDIAGLINNMFEESRADTSGKSYDTVITSYLKRKDYPKVRPEIFDRFLTLLDNLKPEIKKQFLKRAFNQPVMDEVEIEQLIRNITTEDLDRLENIFREHSSLIPESLRNVLDKLQTTKSEGDLFAGISGDNAVIDDIQIDENFLKLFREDHYRAFVSEQYQRELERMLQISSSGDSGLLVEVRKECNDEVIEKKYSSLLLEILNSEFIDRDDYLELLSKITLVVGDLLEKGRFFEISEAYTMVLSHKLTGRFREEAAGMLDACFHSREFIERLIDVLKLWGRYDREGVMQIAINQKGFLAGPLLDALADTGEASVRKFLLQVLSGLGTAILPEVVKRLNDTRWYVIRNMIFLIREAGGADYAKHVRRFALDKNRKVCIEAIKTLLHLRTPDAASYIKNYLKGSDAVLRSLAVRLAGIYKCSGAVPSLIELLDKKDLLGADSHERITVVKALGDIGDPSALNALMKIYDSKALFNKAFLEELKIEVFKSLRNYPQQEALPLIKKGLESKNELIRSICSRFLMEQGKNED